MQRCALLPVCLLALIATGIIALGGLATAQEVNLLSYNILNYPGSTGTSRAPHFRTVLEASAPDLLVAQEVIGQSGVDHFMANVLEILEPGAWVAAPHYDSPDSDRALFLRAELGEILDWGWLTTDLRTIDWWRLRFAESGDTLELYTLHLKASQGSDNEARRLLEAQVLREHLIGLPPDRAYIVAGDYNVYYSDEPAYQHLLATGAGQCLDPIDTPGYWHNNPSFAGIHTQSTRITQFGGGATGGLDDRFDIILSSDELLDDTGLEILPDSYLSFGNDGQHFNTSIIDGENLVVSADVANALHEASDHLPVMVTLALSNPLTSVSTPLAVIALGAWPNPFNPATRLQFELAAPASVRLRIFDTRGRRVATLLDGPLAAGRHEQVWQATQMASGIYIAQLAVDGEPQPSLRLVLMK